MPRASISHIALTVSDLDRSTEFYDKIFKFMGYLRDEVPASIQQAMKSPLRSWVGPGYSISIRPSKGDFARRLHNRDAPGFNHMVLLCGRQGGYRSYAQSSARNRSANPRSTGGISVLAGILRGLFQ